MRLLLLLIWLVSSVDALAALKPFPNAPISTLPIYGEAFGNLVVADLIYTFTAVVKYKRAGKIKLTAPPGFPIQEVKDFEEQSLDLAGKGYNDKNGLKFSEIYNFFTHNAEAIIESGEFDDFNQQLVNMLKELETCYPGWSDNTFLSTFRSVNEDVSCVYGVLKDTMTKRITVVFCGSRDPLGLISGSNKDWRSNLSFYLAQMTTPTRIKDKMKGELQNRVLVHKGQYNYLFKNRKLDNRERPQRYEQIKFDIENALNGETGYQIYVTGHSLGGALAHMVSLGLAGAKEDFIPRPVTCISFAAPFSGTGGYRSAFEQAELDGLLRCLRINNREDLVPTVFPVSLGLGLLNKKRLMKHTGMYLRLKPWGVLVEHSSKDRVASAIRNIWFKPGAIVENAVTALGPHMLPRHLERLNKFKERPDMLKTLEELYEDNTKVGQYFAEGTAYPRYNKDEEKVLTSDEDEE